MAKKKKLSEIIETYLVNNPSHTWKDAQAVLASKGISPSYFCNQKSAMRRKGALPTSQRKNAAKATGKTSSKAAGKTSAKSSAKANGKAPAGARASVSWNPAKGPRNSSPNPHAIDLIEAVKFARSVGGLQNAHELLNELESIQV